ncbi:MAG: YqeG family HAD IIIA-type phosphatase [Candidatus Caenarcaniphilales bacterium]|nr:YqeG family HAD IIIA-type phosphatase [Candidatus Caenarcaniphilales bacterium]
MFCLKPDYLINGDLTGLNLVDLKAAGIKGLLLDLDNTIMLPYRAEWLPDIRRWIEQALDLGLKMIVVTNNKRCDYLKTVEPLLNLYGIKMIGQADKPRRKALKEALRMIDLPADSVCLIGDRVLTDIWGGARLGMKTALVRPLSGKSERKLYQFLRQIEYLCLHPNYRY